MKQTTQALKVWMRICCGITYLSFLFITGHAQAQITDADIQKYLKDSANLVNEDSLYDPELMSEFLETHLSESFRFVDYATLVMNNTEKQQPVVRDKQAYIDEALGSLDKIISVTPKLEIDFVKSQNDGKTGRAKYTLTSISKVRDNQLAEFYMTDIFIITTDSQCDENFGYSKEKQTIQSMRLTCKSRITFEASQ